jgi:hypothetical protein
MKNNMLKSSKFKEKNMSDFNRIFTVAALTLGAGVLVFSFAKSSSQGFDANSVKNSAFRPSDLTFYDDRTNSGLCFAAHGYQRAGQMVGSSSLNAFEVNCDTINMEKNA